ncbi:MAG: sugar ABC transporter substrate-binding protein [Longicatena sp.]
MVKLFIILTAIFLITFMGISVFNKHSKTAFVYRKKEPIKIGATYMTLNNPFFRVIDDEIRNVVEANGDVLISLDPVLDLERQKEQIRYLIKQKVAAIIMNPVNTDGLKAELQMAKEAGIPIITVDSEVNDKDYITYSIMSDNYSAGVQCANDMMKQKESARIVLLEHSDAYSAVQRIQGFVDTIKDNPNYTIVKRIECKGQLEQAMPLMQTFIKEGIAFDVVMSLNDPSALGALAALQANHQVKDVLVYGVDGIPETKALVNDHIMQATVAQSPITMGKLAIENTYRIIEGKSFKKQDRIHVSLITHDNIAEYSLEGWQ